MQGETNGVNHVRFGDFQVDLQTGELHKHGIRVRLQEQPFRVLTALLERPGEVVSREEMIRRLWPDGTFVDYDRSLNAALSRLRQVLVDSAEMPRYVETVAHRGYRFIAPLESGPAAVVSPQPVVAPLNGFSRRTPRILLVALLAGIAVFGSGWYVWRQFGNRAGLQLTTIPLTRDPGHERNASFSPEGNQVAYEWDNGAGSHIFVKVAGVGDAVQLTASAFDDFGPAWSHDGRSIAFVRRLAPNAIGVFVIPALGGVERQLAQFTNDRWRRTGERWLDWSRDDRFLILAATHLAGAPAGLVAISIASGVQTKLTTPMRGHDRSPAVSPDGRYIAFARFFVYGKSDMYTVKVTDDLRPIGEPHRLTSDELANDSPAWTPDGREIVYSSARGGGSALWRLSSIGEGPATRVVGVGNDAVYPAVSRTGLLAYTRAFSDMNIWRQELRSRDAITGAPRVVISSTAWDGIAQYSPDGRRIAFQSDRSGTFEAWVCGSDGVRCGRLTHLNGPHAGSPRWSPDGSRITFTSPAAGNFDVYEIDSSGGPLRRLTDNPSDDVVPAFSHDGKNIYFGSHRSGRAEIWRMPSGGGAAVRVTDSGAFMPVPSSDGKHLYYLKATLMSPLYRIPIGGGKEEMIAPTVMQRAFAVGRDRVYYVEGDKPGPAALYSLNLTAGERLRLTALPKPLGLSLSLSPDGRALLYSQVDQEGGDLMLIANFR